MSAYGYERCFIIEHDYTVKRKIDCKDCNYYDKSDKSCLKTPRYLPEDGYNSWRNCNYFELDNTTSHYEEKKAQYKAWCKRQAKKEIEETKEKFSKKNQKAKASPKTVIREVKKQVTREVKKQVTHEVKKQNTSNEQVNYELTDAECRKLTLCECENFKKIPKPRKHRIMPVYLDNGKKIKVIVCTSGDYAYINAKCYTDECLHEVRRIFRKK